MSLSLLLPLPEGLEITAVSDSRDAVAVRVFSHRASSCCPVCSTPSTAIHSLYRRKPADLPCLGRSLRLLLAVKKFFCRVATCPRKVFTERLPDFLEPCSRLTTRLRTAIQAIGFASTGKAGARLAAKLGIPVTDTTLLWSLHLMPVPMVKDVQKVGIDDWAWRRGQRYGTLLVDLERHQVIELLADRSVASAQQWFEAHPDIELVSRDRGGTHAEAATTGVPLAVQVADRWHLCNPRSARLLAQCVVFFFSEEVPSKRRSRGTLWSRPLCWSGLNTVSSLLPQASGWRAGNEAS